MTVIYIVMAIFSVLGAIDLIIGNRIGIGKEFEKGMTMLGSLALSMVGMIVLAPLIAHFLSPLLQSGSALFEPSAIVSSLFANDMGGAMLSMEFASTEELGYFNGLVVGSMMGATVSFTLPFALGETEKSQRRPLMLGLMCGICAIPVGCVVSGLIAGIPFGALLFDLIPLFVFSAILAFGLIKFPNGSVKVFNVFGIFIKILVTVGLVVGILEAFFGDFVPYTAPISDGFTVIADIAMIMTGAFPLIFLLSKAFNKPLKELSGKIGINETSALGFLSTLATSVTTFKMMKDMDERGVLLNSAFAVSAAFTFADHLAFTLSFNADYVLCVSVGKLVSGIVAVAIAALVFCRKKPTEKSGNVPVTDEK